MRNQITADFVTLCKAKVYGNCRKKHALEEDAEEIWHLGNCFLRGERYYFYHAHYFRIRFYFRFF